MAPIVREHGGERPIVVVSAHQGVTDLLERSAAAAEEGRVVWDEVRVRHRTLLRQLGLHGDLLYRHLRDLRAVLEELSSSPQWNRRSHDFVLSFGERMSARIVAAALRGEGLPAAYAMIVSKMLAKEPKYRYADIPSFLKDIDAAEAGKTPPGALSFNAPSSCASPRLGKRGATGKRRDIGKSTGPRAPITGRGTTGPRVPIGREQTTGPARAVKPIGITTGPSRPTRA